jgi:hypothetical protein
VEVRPPDSVKKLEPLREEGSTPEDGKAPGSPSESGDPQHEAPDSSDRACEGSLLSTGSEERRLRLEEERRTLEKTVEEKLKAGNFAPGEILMGALTMSFADGRDP